MNILDLQAQHVDFGLVDVASAGKTLRVCDVIHDRETLVVKLKGYVEGDVQTKYKPASFMMDLDPFSVEKLVEIETLFTRRHSEKLRGYTFRSSIHDKKYLRIKLRTDKAGRNFAFDTSDRNFTVEKISNGLLVNGLLVELTVALKFYISEEHYGLFFTLEHIEFLY